MGGLQRYQLGTAERQALKPLSACFLVSTGKPNSSTGECVEAVRQHNFRLIGGLNLVKFKNDYYTAWSQTLKVLVCNLI